VDLLEKLKKTDLAKLPPKKKAEIKAKLLDLREKEIAKNRIAYWKPYAWQKRSVEMIRKKTTTLCIASELALYSKEPVSILDSMRNILYFL